MMFDSFNNIGSGYWSSYIQVCLSSHTADERGLGESCYAETSYSQLNGKKERKNRRDGMIEN